MVKKWRSNRGAKIFPIISSHPVDRFSSITMWLLSVIRMLPVDDDEPAEVDLHDELSDDAGAVWFLNERLDVTVG